MLRAPPRQFCLQVVPGDGARAVLVAGGQAALELGLLGWRERHIGIGQAVPQLLDQANALFGRESGDFARDQCADRSTSTM